MRLPAVLILALLAAPARADAPLAYRMAAGDGFTFDVHVSADIPTQGHKDTSARAKARVDSVLGDALRLHLDLASPAKYALAMGVDLAPDGQTSNITGVDMNNDSDAVVAKDAASLGLPALPDAAVAVGTSWQAERTVYLPKAPIPGVPSSVRVDLTYTVKALRTEDGRAVVDVALSGVQPAGQSVKIQATGTWTVEAATGKPLRAHIEGAATMHVVFSDLKLPFVVDGSVPASVLASAR